MKPRTIVGSTAAALALTVVPAYAAIQTPSAATAGAPAATPTRIVASPPATTKPTPGATPTTPAAPAPIPPFAPPANQTGDVPAKASTITASQRFAVKLDPKRQGTLDATWPDAATVFTAEELRQVIPGVTALRARDCTSSKIAGGRSSAHSTRCTLELSITGEREDVRSSIMVNIRGFGLPQAVGNDWTTRATAQRQRAAKRPGLYTFYTNTSLGATAGFTDGTTTRVLLNNGDVSGEIWFSGIGFTQLKSDYLGSRRDYRERVAPALVQLLAAKMKPA